MRGEDSHVAWLRIGIIKWNVLLHGQLQWFFLFIGRRPRVLPYVLAWYDMIDYAKWRHFGFGVEED